VLSEEGYRFKQEPVHFKSFFDKTFDLKDYIALDEYILMTYFETWILEDDEILSDLCDRFVNRRLFQYIDFNPAKEYRKLGELDALFRKAGIDPDYYLVVDSSSDLPYDFYRPGEEEERLPIHLLMRDGELRELSRESDIVDAISGKRRTDHKLYFPEDMLREGKKKKVLRQQILSILNT